MDYKQTLDFMYSSLPMYHRIGQAAYKADLNPTLHFMEALGHPEHQFRSLHVAGTNGKGSVSHLLASVLQEAGYKVGLYTSPHLVDFRERIRINGQMIGTDEVTHFIEKNKDIITQERLSFFEMTVGMAFDHFARHHVDVAVIEVGMGGRLDSTNVITPLLSIITNISLDHTQFLGNTLSQIAREKAGIIKSNVPVVIGQTQSETTPVFTSIAQSLDAPISFADQHFRIVPTHTTADTLHFSLETLPGKPVLMPSDCVFSCPLSGSYQLKNLATLMQALYTLRTTKALCFTDQNIHDGIANVVSNTHLQGRWQTIGTKPLTICETAHNEDGIRSMLERIDTIPHHQLHIVYGCVNDKDYAHILQLLPKEAKWYFSQPSVPRRLEANLLQQAAAQLGINGQAFDNVQEAIATARSHAQADDLVLITGSIFLVADALQGKK